MASSTDAEKLAYVMVILKNTEMPKPDYAAAAVEAGINNANNAYVALPTYYHSHTSLLTGVILPARRNSAPS